jgi:hypothetical protein
MTEVEELREAQSAGDVIAGTLIITRAEIARCTTAASRNALLDAKLLNLRLSVIDEGCDHGWWDVAMNTTPMK